MSALQIGEIALKSLSRLSLAKPHQRTICAQKCRKALTTNRLVARPTQLAGTERVASTAAGRESSDLPFVAMTRVIVPSYKLTVVPVRHGSVTMTPVLREKAFLAPLRQSALQSRRSDALA